MEWMFEVSSSRPSTGESLYCVGLSSETKNDVQTKMSHSGVEFRFASYQELADQIFTSHPAVLLFEVGGGKYRQQLEVIDKFKKQNHSCSLLLIADSLAIDELSEILSEVEVFAVVNQNQALDIQYKKALAHYEDQDKYLNSLDNVKKQNKILESLKENLEGLVHERTKKEFEANKQMEVSVKELQSILNFIKSISRVKTIEDLMVEVRNEFKKFQGVLPPILLLQSQLNNFRVFNFQGKQFSEKSNLLFDQERFFSEMTEKELRAHLSNLLGRPIGSLMSFEFNFKAEELSSFQASLVFEKTLVGQAKETMTASFKERWPVINMALESLLLKESLQNIARQWARTFNEMVDPIIIIDNQYNMSLSNSDFHKSSQKKCYEAFAHKSKVCKECPIQQTFESHEPRTADIRVGEKIFRVHSYPIHLQGFEEASHVINQYVDVTQTIDLQSRVIQGEKMAAVGLLAGNIAHELNNPLTGIFSLSQLMLEDLEPQTTLAKDLTEVKNAAQRCQRIIKDLLEFSDIGTGTHDNAIDVNQLIQKTLPLLKMAMRTLNSEIELYDQPLRVQINSQLLQQVIFNIINNACQAMGDEGHLFVSTQPHGEFVEIKIRDTGPGIPAEIVDSIFDPFFTTKEEGKGTGLGLSMSKSVVERAGGQLLLNNQLTEGTEFQILLPMVKK